MSQCVEVDSQHFNTIFSILTDNDAKRWVPLCGTGNDRSKVVRPSIRPPLCLQLSREKKKNVFREDFLLLFFSLFSFFFIETPWNTSPPRPPSPTQSQTSFDTLSRKQPTKKIIDLNLFCAKHHTLKL